jgi:hypothetical protein
MCCRFARPAPRSPPPLQLRSPRFTLIARVEFVRLVRYLLQFGLEFFVFYCSSISCGCAWSMSDACTLISCQCALQFCLRTEEDTRLLACVSITEPYAFISEKEVWCVRCWGAAVEREVVKMASRVEVHAQKPNSPKDVLIDLGRPLVNRVVDGFIKAGGVRQMDLEFNDISCSSFDSHACLYHYRVVCSWRRVDCIFLPWRFSLLKGEFACVEVMGSRWVLYKQVHRMLFGLCSQVITCRLLALESLRPLETDRSFRCTSHQNSTNIWSDQFFLLGFPCVLRTTCLVLMVWTVLRCRGEWPEIAGACSSTDGQGGLAMG